MKKYLLICSLLLIAIIISCKKDDKLDDVVLNGLGGTWKRTALDNWLYDSLTAPYNIELKYKWDQSEFDMSYTLVPPREEQVIPVARAIRNLWIEPYDQATGTALFMKMYSPKLVVLSGVPAARTDGAGIMGVAEDGLKIILYDVNSFSKKDKRAIDRIMHLLHHEFTHILNQKKAYPVEFNKVSAGSYTDGWQQAENPVSLSFVSNYAMKAPEEDFAEMVAFMLGRGKEEYEAYLHTAPDYEKGIQKLREKEALVVQYFKDAYHIDFYDLQTRVQQAKKAFMD
ncbi:substrate import-associated zinc metallohydrolase lipoprotein [Chitinophaga polysaccharea]|uniref:substrate import-associated zinc metallohydrolase lipoprotein n=1 Tax=Chitinophaga polysaccharea TaxID=1293035 RepID=UPI001158A6E0|nr:substrate import-associated zinc metallohydrolase lipoprotein [Chitinophaga polysaccharea]